MSVNPVLNSPAPAARCRILLVDDNRDFLRSAERFLGVLPHVQVVGCANTGREALTQVEQLRPRVVVMDITMPEMNGLEATRHLKAKPEPPHVIILTMHEDAEFERAALAHGADGFVRKSNLGTELLPLVETFHGGAV